MTNPKIHPRQVADIFWEAYEYYLQDPMTASLFPHSAEKLRFQCLVGFTALDAQVTSFWREEILPEWGEFLSLVEQILDDDPALQTLMELTPGALGKSQWVASLRFLAHTGEPARFSPTLVDVGAGLLIWGGDRTRDPQFAEVAAQLFRLQKIRNAVVHTGRDFNEAMGLEAIELFSKFLDTAAKFSPSFHREHLHVFGEREKKAA